MNCTKVTKILCDFLQQCTAVLLNDGPLVVRDRVEATQTLESLAETRLIEREIAMASDLRYLGNRKCFDESIRIEGVSDVIHPGNR